MRRLFGLSFITAVILPAAIAFAEPAPQQPQARLLTTPKAGLVKRSNPTELRAGRIALDPNLLNDLGAARATEATIRLFDDLEFRAVVNQIDYRSDTSYSIGAALDNLGSTAVFVREGEVVMGNLWTVNDGAYEIRPGDDGYVVRRLNTTVFPGCDTIEQPDIDPLLDAPTEGFVCVDDGSEIRILVLFTPDSLAGIGGPSQMAAFAQMCIATTNQTYLNSGITTRAVLSGFAATDYQESGDGFIDRDRLTNPNDGFIDDIHELRNQVRADVVSMIVEDIDACGVANFSITTGPTAMASLAFNVTRRDCAVGNLSFPHELGHNQGARHDRAADPSVGAFTYSHGFIAPGGAFRTVMGTSNLSAPRIPFFSDPNIMFGGQPAGIADGSPNSAHNSLSINNTAIYVANFRVDECIPFGDISQDMRINGVDLAIILSLWGTDGNGTGADLNGDGIVNGVDLAIVLTNWTG